MNKILLSACLAGFPVRYNGTAKQLADEQLSQWRQQQRIVVFCPELAAGFQTPRPAAEIQPARDGSTTMMQGARVMESGGEDVTGRFILAAWLTLKMAQEHHCRFALLTEGSPSCGNNMIYNGQFNCSKIPGRGFTADLLMRHGIEVFSEYQILQLRDRINQLESPSL